jgi:hypothetical protein
MASRNYITHTVTSTAPPAPSVGDEFYDPTTNLLTKTLVVNGTALQQVVIATAGGPVTANTVTASGNITGGNITSVGIANIAATTAATSTVTGALRTAGGLGVVGNAYVGGALVATTKSFAIQHPNKQDTILYHGCLEGPEHAVYTRGRAITDTIVLPDYWKNLVDSESITVHLTAVGECNTVKVVKITSDAVIIQGSPVVDCFYIIHATRRDVPGLEIEVAGNIKNLYKSE